MCVLRRSWSGSIQTLHRYTMVRCIRPSNYRTKQLTITNLLTIASTNGCRPLTGFSADTKNPCGEARASWRRRGRRLHWRRGKSIKHRRASLCFVGGGGHPITELISSQSSFNHRLRKRAGETTCVSFGGRGAAVYKHCTGTRWSDAFDHRITEQNN